MTVDLSSGATHRPINPSPPPPLSLPPFAPPRSLFLSLFCARVFWFPVATAHITVMLILTLPSTLAIAQPALAMTTKTTVNVSKMSSAGWLANLKVGVVAQPQPPVIMLQRELQQARTTFKNSKNMRVRVISTTNGTVSAIVGSDLAWQPVPRKLPITTKAGATSWIRKALLMRASLFGLNPTVDDWIVTKSARWTRPMAKPNLKTVPTTMYTIRFRRTHQGVSVWGDGLLVQLNNRGTVNHLIARITPAVWLSSASALVAAKLAGQSGGFLPMTGNKTSPAQWLEPVTISPEAGDLVIRRTSDGKIVRTQPLISSARYETVVTRRGPVNGQSSSNLNQCSVTFNAVPIECADTGAPAWRFGGTSNGLCCPACVAGGCQPSCATTCANTGDYFGEITTTVRHSGDMQQRLSQLGVTIVGSGSSDVLVVSGQVAVPGTPPGVPSFSPCEDAGKWPGNSGACSQFSVNTCHGNVSPQTCGEAFFPTIGYNHNCASGIGPAAGTVLMSDAAKSSLDIMSHEFAHIWLAHEGFPYHNTNGVAAQPRVIHEAIADQLAVSVDDDDWLVGDESDCIYYRNLCDPSCTNPGGSADIGCLTQTTGAATCRSQPMHFSNYSIFPNGVLADAAHHNTGILGYGAFLFGSSLTHVVGNQQIHGQGRPKLASVVTAQVVPQLLAFGALPADASRFNLQGYREAMIRGALNLGPIEGEAMASAQDAVGIWRGDGETTLLGVGRVGAFGWLDLQTGDKSLFIINWDGERQNWISRCTISADTCPFVLDMQQISNFVAIEDNAPAAPLATVAVTDQKAAIYYPTVRGEIAIIDFNGGVLTLVGTVPHVLTFTLLPEIGIGAAWDPSWSGTADSDTIIAYYCSSTTSCTCNGITPGAGGSICTTNRSGTWQAEVSHDVGGATRSVTPNVVSVNGIPTVVWAQETWLDDHQKLTVFYSVRPSAGAPWTTPARWITSGEPKQQDLPTYVAGEVVAGTLRGVDSGHDDRVYLQYAVVDPQLPSMAWNDHVAATIPSSQALVFASAMVDPAAPTSGLQRRSMGVAQNGGPFDLHPVFFVQERTSVGGFVHFAGRSWALTRALQAGDPTGVGGMAPDGFARVFVQSLGWR